MKCFTYFLSRFAWNHRWNIPKYHITYFTGPYRQWLRGPCGLPSMPPRPLWGIRNRGAAGIGAELAPSLMPGLSNTEHALYLKPTFQNRYTQVGPPPEPCLPGAPLPSLWSNEDHAKNGDMRLRSPHPPVMCPVL